MATDQEVKDMITRTVLRKEYHEEEFMYWKNFLKELKKLDRIEIWHEEDDEKFQSCRAFLENLRSTGDLYFVDLKQRQI